MPILTFSNPEGKTIKVNSPDGSNPSEQELDQLFSLEMKDTNPAFLPNKAKVEAEIQERPDSVATLGQELQTRWNPAEHPIKAALQPATVALKTAAIPFQRVESAVANVGLEAQEGNINPVSLAIEAWKGVSGQKQGQLGDIVRTTGFGENVPAELGPLKGNLNEVLAAGAGFGASVPVWNATGSAMAKTAGAVGKAKVGSKMLRFSSGKTISEYLKPKDAFLRYGKTPETVPADERIWAWNEGDLANKISKRRSEVGLEIGKVVTPNTKTADYSGAIKVIDDRIVQLTKDNPREMAGLIKKLEDKKLDLLHTKVNKKGQVVSQDDLSNMTLKQAHDFKEQATKTATSNVFSQTPNEDAIFNETLRDVYRSVAKKMTNVEPGLKSLNRRYSNLVSADLSIKHRMNVAKRNTGIVGDLASGALGGVLGHVPGVGAGILAHRAMQTAAFKTTASILLSDIAKGAGKVEDLLAHLSKSPAAVQQAIKAANPQVRLGVMNQIAQKLQQMQTSGQQVSSPNLALGTVGKAGSQAKGFQYVGGKGFISAKEGQENQAQAMLQDLWSKLKDEQGMARISKKSETEKQIAEFQKFAKDSEANGDKIRAQYYLNKIEDLKAGFNEPVKVHKDEIMMEGLEKDLNPPKRTVDEYKRFSDNQIIREFEERFPDEQPEGFDVEEMRALLISELPKKTGFDWNNEKGFANTSKEFVAPKIPNVKTGETADIESHWINKEGKLISQADDSYTHGTIIAENAKQLGFSEQEVKSIIKKYGENYENLDSELIDKGIKRGNIRVNRSGYNNLNLQFNKLDESTANQLIEIIERNPEIKNLNLEDFNSKTLFEGNPKQVITALKAKLRGGKGPSDIAKWHLGNDIGQVAKSPLGVVAGTGATIGAGALLGHASKAEAAQPSDEDLVKTVLGEAEGSGLEGMKWVASGTRNRNKTQGAYGFDAIVVKDGKYYRKGKKGLRLLSDAVVKNAKQAVLDSKNKDFTGGSTNWFSDADLTDPRVQRMIKKGNMVFIKKVGGNSFYREPKQYKHDGKRFKKSK